MLFKNINAIKIKMCTVSLTTREAKHTCIDTFLTQDTVED